MLSHLNIENIAIIERADLRFERGFNVLTGETGAGKSIIIDALSAVLGERTSRDLVRTGAEKGLVTAVFEELSEKTAAAVAALGFSEAADERALMLSREIAADGKTTCRVNGKAVTMALLRDVGRLLVNTHGQHENQTLLSPENHLQTLDVMGDILPLRDTYEAAYHHYCTLKREWNTLTKSADDREKRRELLAFQLAEIDAAALTAGEEEELLETCRLFRDKEKIASELTKAEKALCGEADELSGKDTLGAVDLLFDAAESLRRAAAHYDGATALSERLSSLCADLADCRDEVVATSENFAVDEKTRDNAETRLAEIRKLTAKYGQTVADVLAYGEKCRAELSADEHADERLSVLEAEIEKAETAVIAASETLHNARVIAGKAFAKAVENELCYLDMPHVKMAVAIEPTSLTVTGGDNVEFLLSANVGEPPKPLVKVASGGELSRIMLAIKAVMADKDDIDTLVFDEIDTGISGRAAQKVGDKLREIATSDKRARQILCVTHLAQIASKGHAHLLIEKSVRDGRTFTDVLPLSADGRERELARIISGVENEASLLAAREMLAAN